MDIIELIAIIVLIAAIVFLIYYYIQTANDGNVDFKEILNFSPKKEQTNESMLMDDEVAEKVSMGEKIKYTFKDIDKSYANTTDAFSKRLDSFLDERSEELIENWSLVTTEDLSSLEDLDKRLKAIEEAEKELEEVEETSEESIETVKE